MAYGRGWARDLAELRREFPGFQIWREVTGERTRLVAVRRWPGTSPHTVVTGDPAQLRAVLGERPPAPPGAMSTGPPEGGGQERPQATPSDPGATANEYPQAIADDYPGWGVRYAGGRWTAWCPAVTVHASTGAELRAAIERAITGDEDHDDVSWVP